MEEYKENGDIFIGNKLVCHSYPKPIFIDGPAEIKERVLKRKPTFDGTIIRAYFTTEWKLATMKKNAFESKWKSTKSFGELFEKHIKLEKISSFLNKRFCYTFLLLDTECENYLTHVKDELFHVNTYNVLTEQYVMNEKPLFSETMPTTVECHGWVDRLKSKEGINFERPQRGMMFITKHQTYIQDFQHFTHWKNIIKGHSHMDTFWYLIRTRPTTSNIMVQFCEMYGEKYSKLLYDFQQMVELCCYEWEDENQFTDEFRRIYNLAHDTKQPKEFFLNLSTNDLLSFIETFQKIQIKS